MPLKLYPDGTAGWCHDKKFKPEPIVARKQTEDEIWWLNSMRTHGITATLEAIASLGLSTLANSQKTPKPARGTKGITPHGRRLVRSAAGYLQSKYGRKRLTFFTGTVPEIYLVALRDSRNPRGNWAEICRQFQQKIRYHLQSNGLPASIVGCTEVQEQRLWQSKGLPLHVHALWVGKHKSGGWILSPEQYTELWRETWENVLGIHGDTDWGQSCNVDRIKKDAVGYMGKYMSKGLKCAQSLIERGHEDSLPSTWYFCTNNLRAIYKQNLYVFFGIPGEMALDILRNPVNGLISWAKDITIPGSDGMPWKCGWVGRLAKGVTNAMAYEAICALAD